MVLILIAAFLTFCYVATGVATIFLFIKFKPSYILGSSEDLTGANVLTVLALWPLAILENSTQVIGHFIQQFVPQPKTTPETHNVEEIAEVVATGRKKAR